MESNINDGNQMTEPISIDGNPILSESNKNNNNYDSAEPNADKEQTEIAAPPLNTINDPVLYFDNEKWFSVIQEEA